MGEAVADEAKLALLDILLDGVEKLLLGNLLLSRLLAICSVSLEGFVRDIVSVTIS